MKWLKYYREKKGLSMEKLADIIGVRLNTIWRWENDKASPSVDILSPLASALYITEEELLNGPNNEREFEVKILMGVKSLIGLSGVEVTDNTFLYGVEDNKPQIHLAGKVLIGTPEERAKAREILLKKFDEACWMFDHKDDAAAAANKNIEE